MIKLKEVYKIRQARSILGIYKIGKGLEFSTEIEAIKYIENKIITEIEQLDLAIYQIEGFAFLIEKRYKLEVDI